VIDENFENICNKIFKWFGFGWVCKLIRKVVQICDWVTDIGWKHDFLDYPIVNPYIYQKCLPFN